MDTGFGEYMQYGEEAFDPAGLVQEHIRRCSQLLSEFEQLRDHLNSSWGKGHELPGLSKYVAQVEAEKKYSESLLEKAQKNRSPTPMSFEELTRMTTPSICEVRWDAIKRHRGLLYIDALFSRERPKDIAGVMETGQSAMNRRARKTSKDTDAALVDAVVENGATWLKVFNLSAKQLVWQMTEGGWDWALDDVSDDSDSSLRELEDDEDGSIKILKTVNGIVQAALANRHDYKSPRIHIILSRIQQGQSRDIDYLLKRLRSLGGEDVTVDVDCANSPFNLGTIPPIDSIMSELIYNELDHLTSTLNVDHEILTELSSDITNTHLTPQPWHVPHVRDQILRDGSGNARPLQELHAVLGCRKLVCTQEVASKFRRVVELMGTETEMARARLLLPDETNSKSRNEILEELQKLCIHQVPRDLQLPVQIAEYDYGANVQEAVDSGQLPAIAIPVANDLGERDRSIFLHGWATGFTTLTSNKTAVRKLNRVLGEHRTNDGEVGPRIWVAPNAGNLARRRNLARLERS